MWQEVIVAICVLAAAYFVLRQWLPIGKKNTSTSCGGCNSCSTTKSCNAPKETTH